MIDPNHAELAARLKAQLADLIGEIAEDESEVRQPLDQDFSEQANEIEDIDAARGIEAVHLAEARQIRAALRRIEDGSYGQCSECGSAIQPKRLAALPTATLCIDCAG